MANAESALLSVHNYLDPMGFILCSLQMQVLERLRTHSKQTWIISSAYRQRQSMRGVGGHRRHLTTQHPPLCQTLDIIEQQVGAQKSCDLAVGIQPMFCIFQPSCWLEDKHINHIREAHSVDTATIYVDARAHLLCSFNAGSAECNALYAWKPQTIVRYGNRPLLWETEESLSHSTSRS